jgi:MFS family permease
VTLELSASRRARPRTLVGISLFWVPLALVSDAVVILVLPAKLEGLGHTSPTLLGAVTFLGLLAGALVQPVAGAVSDRVRLMHGRRRVLVLGAFGMVLSIVLLAVSSSVTVIVATFIAVSVAAAVAQAAQQGYMPDQVPESQRGLASGLKGLMDVGGAALGFALLGGLLDVSGPKVALLVVAAVTVGTLAATVSLVPEPRGYAPRHPARPSLRNVLKLDVRKDAPFLAAVTSRFLFLLGTFAVGRFFLFFVEDTVLKGVQEPAGRAGAMLASLALLTGITAPAAGWLADRWGRRRLMVAGALFSAGGVGLLATATSPTLLLAFGSLMSVGSAAFMAANWAQIADAVPPAEASRYFGLANIGAVGAAAAAGLLGPVVDRDGAGFGGGYGVLFTICLSLFVLSAFVISVSPRGTLALQNDSEEAPPVISAER